jgi:hypothetical protein
MDTTIPFQDPELWREFEIPVLRPVTARPVKLTSPEFAQEAESEMERARR